jgi:hypothetical protein
MSVLWIAKERLTQHSHTFKIIYDLDCKYKNQNNIKYTYQSLL